MGKTQTSLRVNKYKSINGSQWTTGKKEVFKFFDSMTLVILPKYMSKETLDRSLILN